MQRFFLAFLLLSACAHGSRRAGDAPRIKLDFSEVTTDAELQTVVRALDEIRFDHPDRTRLRILAQRYLLAKADRALARRRPHTAYDDLSDAVALYAPQELSGELAKDLRDDVGMVPTAGAVRAVFAPRGAEEQVALALAIETTLGTRDQATRARASEKAMFAWIDEVETLEKGPLAKSARVVEVLEQVALRFPTPAVREELTRRYFELHATLGRILRHGLAGQEMRAMLGAHTIVSRLAYRIARVQLRGGDAKRAQTLINRLAGQPGDDPVLRARLDRALSTSAPATDQVVLASHFAREDPDIAERLGLDATQRYPDSADAWGFAARMAGERDDAVAAVRRYERTVALDPRRDWFVALIKHRLALLAELATKDDLTKGKGQGEAELRRVEQLYQRAAKLFPETPMVPPVEQAVAILGRGYYWAGELERAEPLLERAAKAGIAEVNEPLALIRASRTDFAGAAKIFHEAAQATSPPAKVRLLRRKGDSQARAGQMGAATDAWRAALGICDALMSAGLAGEDAAEIEIERARLRYALGDHKRAFRAIEAAIDAVPGRGATYVDAVAFLATRGELQEALDVYLRGMGVEELDDYARIYCSIWVWDLGRRKALPALVAERYLMEADGTEWFHEIARFVSGRISYEEAKRRADTRGERAEVDFYQAQHRLAAGKLDEARVLWQEVLASQMLAFYEYEMAAYFLREGPPDVRATGPDAPKARQH